MTQPTSTSSSWENPLIICEEYRIPSGIITAYVYRGGDTSFTFETNNLVTEITRAEFEALRPLGRPIAHEVRSE